MLQAADLTCERGGRRLFERVSFSLHGGDSLRIAGPNGSGKTSLLRILCGLLAPNSGEVRWQGTPIASLKEEYSKNLVYLGHAPAVKADLTAAENLSVSCSLAGKPVREQDVRQALEQLGLREKGLPVRKLSQGQRRRAALARLALSETVPVWLLDEPFAALDAQGIDLLEGFFKEHLKRGGAIAFTTHQDTGVAARRVLELG